GLIAAAAAELALKREVGRVRIESAVDEHAGARAAPDLDRRAVGKQRGALIGGVGGVALGDVAGREAPGRAVGTGGRRVEVVLRRAGVDRADPTEEPPQTVGRGDELWLWVDPRPAALDGGERRCR